MARIFGTDGVRGAANTVLTPELAFDLGRAGAHVLAKYHKPGINTGILVGKDTRLSGAMLESALTAGILSVGADAYLAGVLPTPALAWLTRQNPVAAGIMITASHNAAIDNGIKFFAHDGCKLSDSLEDEIEYYLHNPLQLPRPAGDEVGQVVEVSSWPHLYLEYLLSLAQVTLEGLYIVLDCANGAVSYLAESLFRRQGARVEMLNASPDGININKACGSTAPAGLVQRIKQRGAHMGFAYDGDGDRLIAVDHQGQVVDGDAILAICATALQEEGRLANNVLVATVMSNLGLEEALAARGIELLRTAVGDRYVAQAMEERGANLGGEQSGHIIFSDYATTGDGLLTSILLAQLVAKSGRSLAGLAEVFRPYPQVLQNVKGADGSHLQKPAVQEAIKKAEKMLQGSGRLLVRPSGTEAVVRVMAEAPAAELAHKAVLAVVRALNHCCGNGA